MLVLTRKPGERILIGNDIVLEVLEVQGNRIRIGIQAPQGVPILRSELLEGKGHLPARVDRTTGELAGIS
ncbi:MAG: carbon storage regulator [Gemmataceae bacterium]